MKKVLTLGVFCAFMLSVVGCQKDMERKHKRHQRRGYSSVQIEQIQKAVCLIAE